MLNWENHDVIIVLAQLIRWFTLKTLKAAYRNLQTVVVLAAVVAYSQCPLTTEHYH